METGNEIKKSNYVYLDYTTKTLGGNYLSTNNKELAKIIGTYSNSNYYGPKLYAVGYNSTFVGLEELLIGMRVGGKATIILPPWLSHLQNSKTWENSSNIIYNIGIKRVIDNIEKFQLDTMKAYANKYYPGLDTTSKGFYFKKLHESKGDTLTNKAVNVYYVGKLLDGFVFDTNIADTAKKYGIYNSNNKYNALSVSISNNVETMASTNKLVKGFCMAIKKMDYGDKAFTMFDSEFGYGAKGNQEIGEYQPLIFWLYIEPK